MGTAAVAWSRFPAGGGLERRRRGRGRGRMFWCESAVSDDHGGEEYRKTNMNMSVENLVEGAMLSDTVFRFLDDDTSTTTSSTSSTDGDEQLQDQDLEEDDEEDKNNPEEKKAFWENQRKTLKETLCRTSSVERTIRNATKEAMREAQMQLANNVVVCVCSDSNNSSSSNRLGPTTTTTTTNNNNISRSSSSSDIIIGCKTCMMREISRRLIDKGFDSAVCTSKWRSSMEKPAGEHTFIAVTIDNKPDENTNTNTNINVNSRMMMTMIIVELNFRAEFEMSTAGDEYSQLVSQLPEALVGKVDRVKAIVKIMCSALKRSCKDNKIHVGPWRKHKYMLAKWTNAKPISNINRPSYHDHHHEQLLSTATKPIHNKPPSMLTLALLASHHHVHVHVHAPSYQ